MFTLQLQGSIKVFQSTPRGSKTVFPRVSHFDLEKKRTLNFFLMQCHNFICFSNRETENMINEWTGDIEVSKSECFQFTI